MSELQDLVALVTGASSGIGEATARMLANKGATVVLVARRAERLEALATAIAEAGGKAFALPCDITDKAAAEGAVRDTVARFGRLDILVNNAGLQIIGPAIEQDIETWEKMIAINQMALLYMTKAALPHLQAAAAREPRHVADIVNMSSVLGRSAWANLSVYNMTKFGVNGFSDALRQEMVKSHVRVGVVEPGSVQTELITRNEGEMKEWVEGFFDSMEVLQPEDIADAVTYMVTRPRRMSVPELFVLPTEQER